MNNKIYINKALEYIKTAWRDEDISLDKIAKHSGFSMSYFDKMFVRETGKSVMEYVRTYKLIRSMNMLRSSDKSILDISLEMGYENPENYSRAFKAVYGIPPSEYREKHKNISLEWKDTSTNTVVKRFEVAFPNLERADMDEFLDYLFLQNPIKYMYNIFFATQSDSAVYKLSNDEYIYVEEFDVPQIDMVLYCKEENIQKYIGMARTFPKFAIGMICEPDFALPEDKYDMAEYTLHENYNYAYLEESIDIPSFPGYTLRELVEADREITEKFANEVKPIIYRIFDQLYSYGNYEGQRLCGLFHESDGLVGVCLPSFESARGMLYSDVGGIFMKKEHDKEELELFLWTWIVDFQLKAGAIPFNGGTANGTEWGIITAENSEKIGYTLISRGFSFVGEN